RRFCMIWISVGILIVQIIIAFVAYFTLYRHRVIYSIETDVLRMPKGTESDIHALRKEHINKRLQEGKYTILQIVERNSDKDLEIIYGQIKK
ncbi:hypothetical protein ACFLVB_03755, partial [Chloroflexota bacterium]